ncbi:Uncharacterised protein [Bacillus freudenreichii]|nr:Uncharacterised protein [Bacillus freudenreichii]
MKSGLKERRRDWERLTEKVEKSKRKNNLFPFAFFAFVLGKLVGPRHLKGIGIQDIHVCISYLCKGDLRTAHYLILIEKLPSFLPEVGSERVTR